MSRTSLRSALNDILEQENFDALKTLCYDHFVQENQKRINERLAQGKEATLATADDIMPILDNYFKTNTNTLEFSTEELEKLKNTIEAFQPDFNGTDLDDVSTEAEKNAIQEHNMKEATAFAAAALLTSKILPSLIIEAKIKTLIQTTLFDIRTKDQSIFGLTRNYLSQYNSIELLLQYITQPNSTEAKLLLIQQAINKENFKNDIRPASLGAKNNPLIKSAAEKAVEEIRKLIEPELENAARLEPTALAPTASP